MYGRPSTPGGVGLAVPGAGAAPRRGGYWRTSHRWREATLAERRVLLLAMLEAVYTKEKDRAAAVHLLVSLGEHR